jgi:hypothetical protein
MVRIHAGPQSDLEEKRAKSCAMTTQMASDEDLKAEIDRLRAESEALKMSLINVVCNAYLTDLTARRQSFLGPLLFA